MMNFWERHFLGMDALIAVALAVALAIWLVFQGERHVEELIHGNRTNIYRTLTGISGTLLGFTLASASFALNAVSSRRLVVLRNSRHYPALWRTFFQTTWFLGALTLTALVCMIWDRDSAPTTWLVVPLVLFTCLCVVRLARTIWVLERVIGIVAKPSPISGSAP